MFARLALWFSLVVLFASPALASSSQQVGDEHVRLRLLSATKAVGEQSPLLLGLEMILANGWHTYWKKPGETGDPPSIDWSGSTNLKKAEMLFPTPLRFGPKELESIGYNGYTVFPLRVTPERVGEPILLRAAVTMLICRELCVPEHHTLSLSLPAGEAVDSVEAVTLRSSLETVPKPATKTAPLGITAIAYGLDSVALTLRGKTKLNAPDVFVETEENYLFQRPTVLIKNDPREAHATIKLLSTLPPGKKLSDIPMIFTLVDGHQAIERAAADIPLSRGAMDDWRASLIVVFTLALLGGLLLNLMPCVLPVLSLKILSMIRSGSRKRRAARLSFLVTSAGIIVSFLLLAIATILLKKLGFLVGWGIQFQQPLFLVFMIALLLFFAASLWDVFTISPPRWIMDRIGGTSQAHLVGDFASGFFATLLATPCSTPFLGTAVGFALAAGAIEILLIFFALGTGMALPFLAIAAFPTLGSFLPKPGPWMNTLSRLLGLGLVGTAVWLMTVLIGQWAPAKSPEVDAQKVFQIFSEERIAAAVGEGKTVFVDITADWCLNCKFNKRFTLSRPEIVKRLADQTKVLALRGDWSSPNPAITDFLNKYGRYGIPFNAVFGPAAPEGIMLPELLTEESILTALDRAGGVER